MRRTGSPREPGVLTKCHPLGNCCGCSCSSCNGSAAVLERISHRAERKPLVAACRAYGPMSAAALVSYGLPVPSSIPKRPRGALTTARGAYGLPTPSPLDGMASRGPSGAAGALSESNAILASTSSHLDIFTPPPVSDAYPLASSGQWLADCRAWALDEVGRVGAPKLIPRSEGGSKAVPVRGP